jgi:SAM-dependent methyltransferase
MKILNVGCGSQTYGTHFVDLYPKREGVLKADVEKRLPFEDETFDEVYSRGLFEHMKNPNMAISEMARVLKRGGKLTVITDNASFWVWALGNTIHTGIYEKKSSAGEEDRHYALFTETHLRNHFRNSGLEVEKVEYTQEAVISRNPIKRTIVGIANKILRLTPFWRASYFHLKVVGRKL